MSSRIDWRNYDYSEGPPKRQRDTNPYTKATDFRARRTLVPASLEITNSAPASALQNSSADDVTEKLHTTTDSIPFSGRRSPRRTEENTSHLSAKLSYRPPVQSTLPLADEVEPSIPEIRRKLTVTCDVSKEPFHSTVDLHSSPANPSPPQPVTPSHEDDLTESVNGNFEKVWQDADDSLEGVVHKNVINYVSEDEDEGPMFHLDRDSFVRDMIATDRRLHERSQSPSKSFSEASVAQLDVDRNFEPVSILRSSGRYTEHDKGERKDHSRSRSVASHASSTSRRKHPWDQDFVEEDDPSVTNVEGSTQESVQDNNAALENQDDVAKEEVTMTVLPVKGEQLVDISNDPHGAVSDNNVNNSHILLNDNIAGGKKGRRKKSRKMDNKIRDNDNYDDDTSIEDTEGNSKRADTLRDRTKQAWSMRNQANVVGGRPRSVDTERQRMELNTQDDRPRQSLVSFQQNTVHEFVPEEESAAESDSATEVTDYTERTGDYTYDDEDTFTGRSMHSMYTKSNESEAEDLFKDLFFIGSGKSTNPGRRQIRYKKEFKEEYKAKARAAQMSDDEDETTFEEQSTIDGSLTSPDQITNRKTLSTIDDDDTLSRTDTKSAGTYDEIGNDPFTITYNYCEDLVKSIASACGLSSKDEDNDNTRSNGSERLENSNVPDETSIVDSFVDYATNAMFPHHKAAFSKEENKKALTELAIHAAITKHNIQNVKYDEMHDLCLNREVKIVKTVIGLPIGIIFAETHTCCWVKRVFETGNAAVKFVGDKIEVGDQLAAVNGLSVMYKNVADVCRVLASASNPEAIELTFVRYVGPLRVAANDQQGYEVIDKKLSKTAKPSPSTLAKKISFPRPRSPKGSGHSVPFPQEITQEKKSQKPVSTSSKGSSKSGAVKKNTEVQRTEKKKGKKKIFSFFRRKK